MRWEGVKVALRTNASELWMDCQGPSGSLVQKGIPVLCLAWRVRRALAPVANCTPPWALETCGLLLSPEERAESTSRTARTSLATDRKCRLMKHSPEVSERLKRC